MHHDARPPVHVSPRESESQRALMWIGIFALAGLIIVLVYPAYLEKGRAYLAIMPMATMVAWVSGVVGILLGLLFGIPRTLTGDMPEGSAAPGQATLSTRYGANTNLEQISDWLTKILVGVGLVQISAIGNGIEELSERLKPALGNQASSGPFGIATSAFFLVCGFLAGYLWTRVYMPRAFREADPAIVTNLVARVDELENQSVRDAELLELVNRQLSTSTPAVDQTSLVNAMRTASDTAKVTAFNVAQQIRSANWKSDGDKEKLARTIPIWQALIDSDPNKQYFRNYGELGFTLKDKAPPDYDGAIVALSEAIRIRDSRNRRSGNEWPMLEFARAICRIKTDAEFANGQPSSPEAAATIAADLRASRTNQKMITLQGTVDEISAWQKLNPAAVNTNSPAGARRGGFRRGTGMRG